eukprot:scaffold1862_cov576-Prasinococcus_capsulatus_cf.AAC.3
MHATSRVGRSGSEDGARWGAGACMLQGDGGGRGGGHRRAVSLQCRAAAAAAARTVQVLVVLFHTTQPGNHRGAREAGRTGAMSFVSEECSLSVDLERGALGSTSDMARIRPPPSTAAPSAP